MMLRCFVTVALVGLPIVTDFVQADETKKATDNLQGTWEVVEAVNNGKVVPEVDRKGVQFVFVGDKLTMTDGKGNKEEFRFKLEPRKKPNTIDMTFLKGENKGSVGVGIYHLEGDNLKFCAPNNLTKDRPSDFVSKEGSNLVLVTLKRVKK